MHYSQSEKMEIIRLVEGSDLGVIRTLRQLKVNKTTFYNWYNAYSKHGYDGLARKRSNYKSIWNKISQADRDKVVEICLENSELSSRELAWRITDKYNYYISESIHNLTPADVYFRKDHRILKQRKKVKSRTLKARKKMNQKLILN